jgi:predicted metal-binding transcription factor (methanogenesis marker protein 9)
MRGWFLDLDHIGSCCDIAWCNVIDKYLQRIKEGKYDYFWNEEVLANDFIQYTKLAVELVNYNTRGNQAKLVQTSVIKEESTGNLRGLIRVKKVIIKTNL